MVNQSPSDTHDSALCTHPDDCYWCGLERESQRMKRQQALKMLAEAGVFSGEEPTVPRRILTAIERDQRLASLTTVRAAVADVLYAGYKFKNHAKPCPWLFFHGESDKQAELRERFMDAVVQRITALQAPPHEMDAELLMEVAKTGEKR